MEGGWPARVDYRGSQWDAELAAPGTERTGNHVYRRHARLHAADRRTSCMRRVSRSAVPVSGCPSEDFHVDRVVHRHACAVRRRIDRRPQGDPHGTATTGVRRRTPRPLLCGAPAWPRFRRSVHRSCCLSARPARDPARRAEPDLHHAREHALQVDGILYFQVTDPKLASYGSSNYVFTITRLARTTLRSIIGRMELDSVKDATRSTCRWSRPRRSAASWASRCCASRSRA